MNEPLPPPPVTTDLLRLVAQTSLSILELILARFTTNQKVKTMLWKMEVRCCSRDVGPEFKPQHQRKQLPNGRLNEVLVKKRILRLGMHRSVALLGCIRHHSS